MGCPAVPLIITVRGGLMAWHSTCSTMEAKKSEVPLCGTPARCLCGAPTVCLCSAPVGCPWPLPRCLRRVPRAWPSALEWRRPTGTPPRPAPPMPAGPHQRRRPALTLSPNGLSNRRAQEKNVWKECFLFFNRNDSVRRYLFQKMPTLKLIPRGLGAKRARGERTRADTE